MSVEVNLAGTSARVLRLPPEPARLVWCDWLRRHSIDPNDVIVPGAIIRSVDLRRVVYLTMARDATGRPVVDGDAVRTVERVVQLESPPQPFPAAGVSQA